MRNTLVTAGTLAIVFIPSLLQAQPVIRRADLAPVGYTTTMSQSTGTASPGAAGAGQTWDFSTLTFMASGTITAADPATTPYASTYPTATHAWKLDIPMVGTGYSYQLVSDAKMESIADGVTAAGAANVYQNAQTTLVFPMAFGDSVIDTYQYIGGAVQTVTLTYDGYGTVKFPGGATYANCIRVRKQSAEDPGFIWYRTAPIFPIAIYSEEMITALLPAATAIRPLVGNGSGRAGGFRIQAGRAAVKVAFSGPVPAGARLSVIRLNGDTHEFDLAGVGPDGLTLGGLAAGVAGYRLTGPDGLSATGRIVIP